MIDADDDDIIVAHGGAQPGDEHLLADVVAVDSDIITYLAEMAAPIGFTDSQFEMILLAAARLPRARRDHFRRAVAGQLTARPSDAEVAAAIMEVNQRNK